MQNDLEKLEKDWASRLGSFDYVGELILTKIEYRHYSNLYAQRCKVNSINSLALPYDTLLVVLAVNCAYFEYDSDGFWCHFLKCIGFNGRNDLQQNIGSVIEKYLIQNNFLERKRHGGFRYVGAVLEQCGITRRYLERFVVFFNTASNKFGWAGLAVISPNVYKTLIPEEGMSGYLKKFLADESGFDFVRTVARSMEQSRHHRNQLDYLISLKGFRPSFWKEFLKLLEHDFTSRFLPQLPFSLVPEPKLIYQPRLNRLAILFDEDHVRSGCYQINNEMVTKAAMELCHASDFKQSHLVMVKVKKQEWSKVNILGWSLEKRPFAFFDIDTGEVLPDLNNFGEGEYYIVNKDQYLRELKATQRQRFEDAIVSDYFWLSPPHLDLRGYKLELHSQSNLDFLINIDSGKSGKLLAWENQYGLLNGAEDLCDVFVKKIPDVILADPGLFRSGSLILMMNIGDGPQKIKIPNAGDSIKLEVFHSSRGDIWVEPVGRQRSFDFGINHKLSFYCLPECKLIWPETLLAYNEKAVVELQGDMNVSLKMASECTPLDDEKRKWELPANQTFIEGILQVNGHNIQLAKILRRASIINKLQQPIRTVTQKDFFAHDDLFVTGYPGNQAKMFLRTSDRDVKLAELGRFDSSGKIPFSTTTVLDTIRRSSHAVGQIGIGRTDNIVLTETILINISRVIKLLESDDNVSWSEGFDWDWKDSLDIFHRAINQRLVDCSIDICDDLPEEFRHWGRKVLACASIFDGVRIDGFYLHSNGDKYIEALEWYSETYSFIHAENSSNFDSKINLLEQLSSITWRPQIKRWSDAFDAMVSALRLDSELSDQLVEWNKEVLTGEILPEYESRIGKMFRGRSLTNAWIRYRKGKKKQAFSLAQTIIESSSSPVKDLACILVNIIRLSSDMTQQVETNVGEFHKILWPIGEWTIELCKARNGASSHLLDKNKEVVDLSILPLTEDDINNLKK